MIANERQEFCIKLNNFNPTGLSNGVYYYRIVAIGKGRTYSQFN